MIRPLIFSNIPAVFQLMKEFADFDGSSSELNLDIHRFEEVFNPDTVSIHTLVLELDHQLVGFINYYYTFSSFELAKCIWVEDAFIRSPYRSKGWGRKLFESIKDIAKQNHCSRIDWLVRAQNSSSRRFYTNLGAKVDPSTIHVKWLINE